MLTKPVSYQCKYKIDGRKPNLNQKWNDNKCGYGCKNIIYVKKIIFAILLYIVVKMVNI